jgi:hypothetical protein
MRYCSNQKMQGQRATPGKSKSLSPDLSHSESDIIIDEEGSSLIPTRIRGGDLEDVDHEMINEDEVNYITRHNSEPAHRIKVRNSDGRPSSSSGIHSKI